MLLAFDRNHVLFQIKKQLKFLISFAFKRSLAETIHKKFFIDLDKKTVSERRVTRNYVPPDPPNYFDLFVWPLYLENRKQLQDFQISNLNTNLEPKLTVH